MKRKNGFTLAEVIITVCIIGITAAITLPGIINHTSSKISGASVGRAAELVELGLKNVFNNAANNNINAVNLADLTIGDVFGDANFGNAYTSADFIANGSNLFDLTKSLMGTESVSNAYLANVIMYNNNAISSTYQDFNGYSVYRFLKTNMNIIVQPIPALTNQQASDESIIITKIFIDANGNKAPNKMGVDIFLFGLSNKGHMIPAGSNEYNHNVFNNQNVSLYTNANTGCLNVITDGRPCAARIVRDGWRINY